LLEQDIEIIVKDSSNKYESFGHLKVVLNNFNAGQTLK